VTRRIYGPGPDGETALVIVSSTYGGGGPLVMVAHGTGSSPSFYLPSTMRRDLDMLASIGCVVLIPDLGGANTWGLDLAVHPSTGRIATARTWAAANYGADLTRMALIGDSMGGQNAILYHRLIPANVKCTVLRCPVVAADALHDRDGAGLGALMNAAYGSAPNWEAAVPTKDPSHANQTAVISTFASKVRAFYSTNDPNILTSDVTNFAAATGVSIRPMGAVGHSPTSVHARAQADFIWSKLNA